jgi:geranylgeranyl reductase family protein
MQTLETDILIAGAGPAGCAAALFLAKAGVQNIILCEKSAFPRDKVCGDALSGKVVEVLRKLDPDLPGELHADPSRFLGSWGVNFIAPGGENLHVPFRRKPEAGTPPPGFISTRVTFDDFLFEKTKSIPGIRILQNTALRHYRREETHMMASTSGEELQIKAKLLIAADGPSSGVAKAFAAWEVEPQHLCYGIRAYYEGVEGLDPNGFIELHFLKELLPGYFWIFPLPGGRANVGLGMRADVIRQKKLNLPRLLDHVLSQRPELKKRFLNAKPIDEVRLHALPLGSVQRPLSGNRFMLTGDAAALIDPFTGEGIGNALMSGMLAAETAAAALREKRTDADFLAAYDKAVYRRLGQELKLSYRMQQLVNYPWLFDFVVKRANRNATLRETISCMFEDLDLRDRLRKPSFYFKLLFSSR